MHKYIMWNRYTTDFERDSQMGKRLINFDLSQQQLEKEIKRTQHHRNRRRAIRHAVSGFLVLAAISVLAATLWFPVLEITGSSMEPLLESGHVVLTYRTRELQPGDVAAFYHDNRILVKRVIAVAGDWVEIDDAGVVSINGEGLDEPYLQKAVLKPSDVTYPVQVPSGCVFVMGDNRAISMDSRLSEIGPISHDRILGKIVCRIWPLDLLEFLG